MCYPGLNSVSKSHLYKSIGLPTLCYGLESINITDKQMHENVRIHAGWHYETGMWTQTKFLAIVIYCVHWILTILELVDITILNHCLIVYVPSPTRNLCIYMMSQYVTKGLLSPS